jgi:hypothetical protein
MAGLFRTLSGATALHRFKPFLAESRHTVDLNFISTLGDIKS